MYSVHSSEFHGTEIQPILRCLIIKAPEDRLNFGAVKLGVVQWIREVVPVEIWNFLKFYWRARLERQLPYPSSLTILDPVFTDSPRIMATTPCLILYDAL